MSKPEWYFVWLLIFYFIIPGPNLLAQDLLSSRTTSPFTYIFKISDKEAKKIYRKGFDYKSTTFLHNLIDSFPTDSSYHKKLAPGHYIKTFADKNQQKYFITSVQNFEVMILTNNKDLMVRVYDSIGSLVENAKVKAGRKSLRYDTDLKAYVDKRSNRKGVLMLEHQGQRAYYDLARSRNNPALLRATNYMLLETPLKYAWMPVHFLLSLPVDTFRWLQYGWVQGSVAQTGRFFQRVGGRVACHFDDYYCDDYYERFEDSHKGYMAFNKPKYQPGDTVKLKAFVVNKRGKPVANDVDVVMYHRNRRLVLGNISCYNPGGYSYEFFLHDSLQLQLNRSYTINLEQKPGKNYISDSFNYEDYELSGLKLSLRTSGTKHYRQLPFYLYVKGTDENDLQVMDGRLEIILLRKDVDKYFSAAAFLPDTLLTLNIPIDFNQETQIQLPDSVIPQANLTYEIVTRLLTVSNETLLQSKSIQFIHEEKGFEITQENDSLLVRYLKNGLEKEVSATIFGIDNFENSVLVAEAKTPLKTDISPWFASYRVEGDGIEEEKPVSSLQPQINFLTHRTRDSLKVNVLNPLGLPVSYQLYRRNRLVAKGHSADPLLNIRARSRKNYFLGVNYMWGGKMIQTTYRVGLDDHKLSVNAIQPNLIYPGQKATIELLVTDIDGKPVEGVDVTAQGLTSKFGYTPPPLPLMGDYGKNMRRINSFRFGDFNAQTGYSSKLDFDLWSQQHGLDSLDYYRFLYPGIFQIFEFYTTDSITQFAPFIMYEGKPEPIFVVYVDHKPVWFSFGNVSQPWSFRVQSGFRHVRIRTRNKEYVIPFLHFKEGRKLVLSIDKNVSNNQILVYSRRARLGNHERHLLSNYLFVYRSPGNNRDHWIVNGDNVLRLESRFRGFGHNQEQATGPLAGNVKFVMHERYDLSFRHEPGFEYDFAPGILKMRSVDALAFVPRILFYAPSLGNYHDEVITEKMLINLREAMVAERRNNMLYNRNPFRSIPGTGSVEIAYINPEKSHQPENILIYNLNDPSDFRLYRGNQRQFMSLKPGQYRLVFLYPGNKFLLNDQPIKAFGVNYFTVDNGAEFHNHRPYREFRNLISELYDRFGKGFFIPLPEPHAEESPDGPLKFTGTLVTGTVMDGTDGSTLPGVNIFVKGTKVGVITDIDGNYQINVPDSESVLTFSFIGYEILELPAWKANLQQIFLNADILALDEVVVVGYGRQRRISVYASEMDVVDDEVFTSSLQGRVGGVAVISGSPGVAIRGISSIDAQSPPLYIIDGIPFMGDLSTLDPALFASMEVLKSQDAVAIYGARAANGVILISTHGGFAQLQNIVPQPKTFAMSEFAGSSNTLRTNFSDYAFWQPQLITDKQGKVSFEVTFPDDITSWDTHYLAMNGNRQTGSSSGNIRSYLPLSAQMAFPRFLIQSDTAFALGRVFNYLGDSVIADTRFLIDDTLVKEKTISFTHSMIDTLILMPQTTDSLKLTWTVNRNDGYFDGEERYLAIYPQGLKENTGAFHVLYRDSVMQLSFDENLGNVRLYARANAMDVMEEEIENILDFRYYCNEQIASRIKALVALKLIQEARNEPFTRNQLMNHFIRRLLQNQTRPGMWGWWKESEPRAWITLHAMEALEMASSVGFDVPLIQQDIARFWVGEMEKGTTSTEMAFILKILLKINASVNYQAYLERIEDADYLPLNIYLGLMQIRQKAGLPYTIDTIWTFKKESLTGDIWFSNDTNHYSLWRNDIQTTLLAYQILENDTADHVDILQGIRNYFLSERRSGFWRNTYEASRLVETMVPYILKEAKLSDMTELSFSGDIDLTISEFPFEMDAGVIQNFSLSKKGGLPVYFSAWQTWYNPEPEFKAGDLWVTTKFLDRPVGNLLEAGKEVTLRATVKVLKEAEYTMITIPIPAGCSYSDAQNKSRGEVHREYFRNEVVIFCEKLPLGDYTFDVKLNPRYAGHYHLNPAQVKLMYFPVFNANETMKKITIE